jgi:hypothetical protein
LNIHCPARIVFIGDVLKQVALIAFAVFGNDCLGFLIRQVLYSLLCFQMKLYPEAFVFGIDKLKVWLPKPCIWRKE